ncbi:hypothetical protein [Aureispira anguillae]|uniref:Lipoprotein n=1 Tax=Aureispira anguillae TaxID=2864201 RepID=A0A916DU02_9BACT|nr:hypothetical protein [Aureispira anguillae]BDS12252.1 hypothetical protein AsAng_0029710 [Aureispira anguillae]
MFKSIKTRKRFLIGILSLFTIISCTNTNSDSKPCKYKPPVAIFEGIDRFSNHSFEVTGQDAVERVFIPKMNMTIELYQSGCDFLQQEYRILLEEAYPLNTPAEVCALHISNIFLILAGEAPEKLGLFQQWAAAIQAAAKSFKYNEKILLKGTAIHAQIDKTHQTESAMLSIIFSQ